MKKIIVLTLISAIIQGCAFVSMDLKGLMSLPPLEEKKILHGSRDKILVLEVLGPITITSGESRFLPSEGTLERLDAVLAKARKDSSIKGIILKIDSPGGGLTASDLVYREIMEFKKSRGIPVVSVIVGEGTSGAYMAALAGDKIVALPSSIVGNIGVLLPSVSLAGLMDKLGIKNQTITSGRFKDTGNPLRNMTDKDRDILRSIVMDFYNNFLKRVEHRRPLTKHDIEVVKDGRVMTASQALKYHLIDEVGYFNDALDMVENMANAKGATVVVYRRSGEKTGGFYSWP